MSKDQVNGSAVEGAEREYSFVEMARAADKRSKRQLMKAVDKEGECTEIDAGDNIREAVLLQIEEWGWRGPREAMNALGALAGAALEAIDGISARYKEPAVAGLIGVAAESDRHYYPVGLYTSMKAAQRAALEDIRAKNDQVSAEVLEAWEAGRLAEALEVWHEEQESADAPVEYLFLDF